MRVAVIGCGVGGMAAALSLSRNGHAVEIFERFPEPRPLGAGLLLQPTGLAALKALGLEAAARDWGAEVTRLDGWTRRGGTVLDLPYKGPTGLGIHRGALFKVLHDAVLADGIAVRGGVAVQAIDGGEREHATLTDAAGERHDTFDLVVVADGAHSTLRTNVTPRARAPIYRWGAFWAMVPDPEGVWSGALRQVYDGARIMIGVLPVGRSPAPPPGFEDACGPETPCVSFFWSLKTTEFTGARGQGVEALKTAVAEVWPDAGALIAPFEDFAPLADASYRNVAARPWVRGRQVLIGDAAHGTSPQLGQGANLALLDALALADAIGPADAERPVDEALQAYVRARSAHTAYYQWMSWLLTPVFQGDSALVAWVRDRTMATLCRAPFTGSMMRATLAGRATFGLKRWRGAWEDDAASGHAQEATP